MVTFAAVTVILFSPRSEDAYPTIISFAMGTAIAVAIAAVVNFAVLPAQQDFLGLALVLACVMVPCGALSAGTWHKVIFIAILATFFPLLAPLNLPVYDPGQFYNAALPILSGIIAAAIALRLIPPLSPAYRTQRLLLLTLRDLYRIAVRRHWPDRSTWIGVGSGRLAAMPLQATLEEIAQLLAALSVGGMMIHLRSARDSLAQPELLDRALECFARADLAGTQDWLSRFSTAQMSGESPAALPGMRACAAAATINEALDRHPDFFATAIGGR
jgi:uncharacterized membrane protein YccC